MKTLFGTRRTSKYGVLLKGYGCRIRGSSLDRHDADVLYMGFFTTRFVQASSRDDAVNEAKRLVAQELMSLLVDQNIESIPLEVEEVFEDPEDFDERAPGSGYTFFEQQH